MGIVKRRVYKTADSITKELLSLKKDKKQIESLVKSTGLSIDFLKSATDDVKQMVKETIKNKLLGEFALKFLYDNLTESELETAEQIVKEFNENREFLGLK